MADITTSMIIHCPLTDDANDTVVTNLVGVDAILQGGKTTAQINLGENNGLGGSLSDGGFGLNGSTDHVSSSVTLDTGGVWTACIWLKHDGLEVDGADGLIGTDAINTSLLSFQYANESDLIVFLGGYTVGVEMGVFSGAGPNGSTDWIHYAVTHDGTGNLRLYLDGILRDTQYLSAPIGSTRTIQFGRRGNEYISGAMVDGRLYAGRVLASDDIAALYELSIDSAVNSPSLEDFSSSYLKVNTGNGFSTKNAGLFPPSVSDQLNSRFR